MNCFSWMTSKMKGQTLVLLNTEIIRKGCNSVETEPSSFAGITSGIKTTSPRFYSALSSLTAVLLSLFSSFVVQLPVSLFLPFSAAWNFTENTELNAPQVTQDHRLLQALPELTGTDLFAYILHGNGLPNTWTVQMIQIIHQKVDKVEHHFI